MKGHFSSSLYKRMSAKELTSIAAEDGSAWFVNAAMQENSNLNPPWYRSLPHVSVAILTSFLFGYHAGVVNEPLESISLDLGFGGNSLAEGLVVSTCLAGAFLGCTFSGWAADGIGRRRAFQLSALPMIIGPVISATAKTLGSMLVGRFLVGTGLGLGPPVTSLYLAEISPSHLRGTYGSFTQLATCLGIIAAILVGIPVKSVTGWWRVCFWVSTAPAVALAFCMEFCAESPHWLYKHGRIGETEEEFGRLLGSPYVKMAMAGLSRSGRGDDTENVRLGELFNSRHFRVVFVGSVLFTFQQLSGINAVFYFSSTVFKGAGVPSDMANICIGVVNLLGSIAAMLMMDKAGRKMPLFGSFLGMAVAMGFQAILSSFKSTGTGAMYLSVGGILMFVLAFSLGAGPVPSILLAEIFSNRIRAKAMAICMSIHWVFNFLIGLLFLPLLEKLGPQIVYLVFASFSLLASIFVKRNVMETKGKTLQEIEISLLPTE